MRSLAVSVGCLAIIAMFAVQSNAQKFEIHPYAGGFFPGKFAGVIPLKNEGVYGLKAGFFFAGRLEAEGHVGYINNLNLEGDLTRRRGYIWEGLASYHFIASPKVYGSFGLGGVTTTVRDDDTFLISPNSRTRDSFLSMSYGGGIKTLRTWGPVGYRVDLRGRSLPDYYGFRLNWLEATAGLTFSWGER